MSELIDRNKAYLAIEDLKKIHFDRTVVLTKAQKTIMELPTIEPKTGKWIKHIDDLFPEESTIECDQCHEHQPLTIDDNFCPNCGAKMTEGDAE